MENIRSIIEQKVRPVLNAHNGDIELLEVTEDGFVKVRLIGACATCQGAEQTMAAVVETAVREVYPDIKGVLAVHQVSDDLIHQALQILRKDKHK